MERIQRRNWGTRGWLWLDRLLQDASYGLRQLRRNPGFAAVAVITLALGIGANTAIFTLIDSVMLRAMPVRDPSQLVLFRWQARHPPQNIGTWSFGDCSGRFAGASASGCSLPLPVFEKFQSQTRLFGGVTAFAGPLQLDMSGNGAPRIVQGELVSGSYFRTLGVSPALGRLIVPSDDTPTASPVIVLSFAYWQNAFGGSKRTVGRTVELNNVPVTIAGVAAPSFTRLSPGKTQDFWLPFAASQRLNISSWGTALQRTESMTQWWVVLLGRLRPGVSRAQAQAAASVIFHNMVLHAAGKPMFKPHDDPAIALVPAQQGLSGIRGLFRTPLYVLMFAVGFILLIACANVGGLLLARGKARQKEMAVRLAVGAGRARIVRQLLTESMVLSAFGGLLGILFAYWGVHALTKLMWGRSDHSISFVVGPDWRVLLFAISATILTGILFGVAPALHGTSVDLTPALKDNTLAFQEGTSAARRWLHLGDALVVVQVGLSVVLLVGAGLLVRTLENLRDINPGFDTHNLLTFGIDPTSLGYKDSQIRNLYREMRSRLAAIPGVTSVSYSTFPVLAGSSWTEDIYIEGHSGKDTAGMVSAGPDFFHTLRLPLLEGRTFGSTDFEQALEVNRAEKAESAKKKASDLAPPGPATESQKPAVPPEPVLINRMFARTYFPHHNPVGKRMWTDKSKKHMWEVVGVVSDAKIVNLREPIRPTVYVPDTGGEAFFAMRAGEDPTALIPTVRKLMNEIDRHLPLFDVRTQTQNMNDLLGQERFISRVSSVFGVLALLLASIGLYGLLSYEVSRRTREIGIRMALGAERGTVLRLVLRQGLKLTLLGLALGAAGAMVLTRFLGSLLYGVKPSDPVTFGLISIILMAVAALACYLPSRRAALVDPMAALRCE